MRIVFSLLFLFSTSLCLSQKALLVIVDGIPADVIESRPTPDIDKISKIGVYSRLTVGGVKATYSQTPTISAVSYNTLLTGTWVNKHNVWNNSIQKPNYNYWTIFKFLKETQPTKKTAIYSTWTDNRTKLLGTDQVKIDYAFDGYELDTLKFPHDKKSDYIHQIDEEVVSQAVKNIIQVGPDLSWLYLQYTDDMGHAYGDSPQMDLAIAKMDAQIGKIWEAISYRIDEMKEDWLLIIVTDHGRDIATGKSHGGQSHRERTSWVVSNAANFNAYFHVYPPQMVDVLPTVAQFLKLSIPSNRKYELDGISWLGPLSITEMEAKIMKNKIRIDWVPFTPQGKVKIKVASTNHFEENGTFDSYETWGEFDINSSKAEFDIPTNTKFLKIVVEGEHNSLNRWLMMSE